MRFTQWSSLRRYSYNTGWLIADRGFRILTNLAASVVVARYLEPDRFGVLSYILSLVNLFAAFANLGFDEIVVKHLVDNENDHHTTLGSALLLRLLSAVIGIFFIVCTSFATEASSEIRWLTFFVSLGILIQASNVVDLYFQSKVLSKYSAIANICQQAISTSLRFALVYWKAPLAAFVLAYLFDFVLQATAIIAVFKWRVGGFLQWKHSLPLMRRWLKLGFPLALSAIITSIYVRMDQVMIKSILGTAMVGQYAVTISLTEVWYFIPVLICQSFFPAIVRSKAAHPKIYYERLQYLTDFLATFAIVISLGTMALAGPLVGTLFGEKYSMATLALKVNIWSTVFVFIGSVSSKWFVIEGAYRKNLIRIILGIFSKMILNYFLILKFSIIGAALATLIAHFIASYLYDVIDRDCWVMWKLKTKAIFSLPRYVVSWVRR